MGVISSDNFDPTRCYLGVRLQQGVPIIDRDWNEMEDIRKFELRAFLKWFIGDGVPSRVGVAGGNDAFKIDSPGGSTDTTFTSQPLHASQAGAITLAAAWGVPVIQALSLPTAANTVAVVYLDVWDRLVTPTED